MTAPLSFKPSQELRNKIEELAKSEFENVNKFLIHIVEKYFDMENRYAVLDDHCPALCYIDDHYECRWGRMGRPPETKKVGKTIEAVRNGCGSCKKTIDMKEKLITLEQQLAEGYTQKIPQCARGAKLNEAMDEFNCPQVGKWRPIIDRKKSKDYKPCRLGGKQNANCQYLSFSTVKIKGKLPTGQNL